MGRQAIRAIGWLLSGMVLMGGLVWVFMPSMMLVLHKSPLGYQETINALNGVIESRPDWKVPATYDFQETIQDAGHGPIEPVGAIALCNPHYASRILLSDDNKKVTAFMPLGIGVYQDKDGDVYVSELNVALIGMMFGGAIADVMADAGNDISEIISLATAR